MGITVELHRALLTAGHPFGFDVDELWANTEPAPVAPPGVRVFRPSYLLLHACIHFAYMHMFRQGAWRTFRDVARIVSLARFSWPDFVALATRVRAASCAYWVLRLARGIAGVEIPSDVSAALAPPMPERVRVLIERHLCLVLTPGARDCPSITLRRLLWTSSIRPRWSGHGDARPWTLFTGVIGALAEATPPSVDGRGERPTAGAWGRYLSTVLTGR
jgi:hypothetical protein